MTGRRLTVAANHPDGRLRLGDLRRLVAGADSDVTFGDIIDDDALVTVAPNWGRGRTAITITERDEQ